MAMSEIGMEDGQNFLTPIMENRFITIPQAPIKQRKRFESARLKPKKLIFIEENMAIDQQNSEGQLVKPLKVSCKKTPKSRLSDKTNIEFAPQKGTTRITGNAQTIRHCINNNKSKIEKLPERKGNKVKGTDLVNNENSDSARTVDITLTPLTQIDSSQYNNGNSENWKDKLRSLQRYRDIGMWIQCCNNECKKWRYVDDYHDPVDVPELWFCHMNSDIDTASCNIPERTNPPHVQKDLIENKYTAGSVVWAPRSFAAGCYYVWWPAMVDDCPHTFKYYELKGTSIIPVEYHVIFFNAREIECAWIKAKSIKPFNTKEDIFMKKTRLYDLHADQLEASCNLARNAITMTILKRLEKFSFVSRYENCDFSETLDAVAPLETQEMENVDTGIDTIDDDDIIPSSQPELDSIIKLTRSMCTQSSI